MNRDKQIEEIKKVLVRTCKRVRTAQEDYVQDRYAKALYNAGYRKASEVAEEIFAEIEKLFFANGVFIHIHSYNELKKKYTKQE